MMKMMKICCLAFVLLCCMCGCSQRPKTTQQATVANVFTPTEEATDSLSQLTQEATEASEYVPIMQEMSSINSQGLLKYELDEVGHCIIYNGGQMHIPYSFTYSGDALAKYGVAIYLCIDGRLQPFYTDIDSTVRYVHILQPEEKSSGTVEVDLIFNPITGQCGDVLDLNIISKQYPLWKWGDTEAEISGYTSGISTRIKFAQSPPMEELPENTDRLISWQCTYQDANHSEYESWTNHAYSLLERSMRVNHSDQRYAFGVDADKALEVSFELMNTAGVDYGLILFLDHQPIATATDDLIYVQHSNSQKALITVQIDMADFDGRGKIHAFLIPRNYIAAYGYESDDVIDFVATTEVHLFAESSWSEVIEK